MKISHFLKYSLGVAFFLSLPACESDTVYYSYAPIPANGWSKNDTLEFYLPDSLTPGKYNLEVGIRHSGKYAYRDLWLELTHSIPNPKSSTDRIETIDTIHVYLASKKGNWNGTGTTGGHFQLLLPSGSFIFPSFQENVKEDSISKEAHLETGASISSKNTSKNSLKKKYTLEGKPHIPKIKAKHHLKVVHIMTDSLLHHITDIGLRLSGPVKPTK